MVLATYCIKNILYIILLEETGIISLFDKK